MSVELGNSGVLFLIALWAIIGILSRCHSELPTCGDAIGMPVDAGYYVLPERCR
jgi:hypothetical protein